MKTTADRLIYIFSVLIAINILVIANLLIGNTKAEKSENVYSPSSVTVEPPGVGFAEVLSMTAPKSQVLAVATEALPTPTPLPTPSKENYVVAAIGDSMIETMGDSLDYLQTGMKKKYPKTSFTWYNYGIGSENILEGLARFDKPFEHGNRHYPPLEDIKPDILIIGSYAYNPLVPYDKGKHYTNLVELIIRARQIAPGTKVHLLAEIAPLEHGFGTGQGGVNWPEELASAHVRKIMEQMQNVFVASRNLNVPVINVYDRSLKANSLFGSEEYVSTHDHIHPSILGQTLTGETITEAIIVN